ncbi:MAG: DegV family protein [Anaerolineae bacterium]|nr:DegV family protein [Anaerolineae bacterium]
MSQVRIVTDSLSDIPDEIAQELDIVRVPCFVHFGETSYRDRVDLSPAEFYKKLQTSPLIPSTSQASPGTFLDIFGELSVKTNQIYSIHTVKTLTGMYNSARLAAQALKTTDPLGMQIQVVDSQATSMGLGWLAIYAARAARYGYALDEIKELIDDVIPRTHAIAMLDTLDYAVRGGRLGKGAALVGGLLNVKPIISLVNGEVLLVEKIRTQKRAVERIADIVLGSGPIQELSIIHAAAPELAESLRKHFAETWFEEQIMVCETGPVIGAHTGPGAVGVAWINGKY